MKRLAIFMVLILVLLQGGNDMIVRTKKVTDAAYSPSPSISGAAIRSQVDGTVQEVADLIELDITNNKKLSPTGDFTGTVNGGKPITDADPFLSAEFHAFKSDNATKFNEIDSNILAVQTEKADKTEVNALATAKANQSSLDTTNTIVASNYSALDTKINSQASGSPKATFATLVALQADATANTVDGKKSIYIVTADGKWYYWNGTTWTAAGTYQATGIAKGSITPDNLSFPPVLGIASKNLFDKSNYTNGYYLNDGTGALIANADYCTSDYTSVNPSTIYTVSNGSAWQEMYVFYDSNKTYISGSSGGSGASLTFTTPSNTAYMKISFHLSQLGTLQLETGSLRTIYQSGGNKLDGEYIKKGSIPSDALGFTVGIDGKTKQVITVKQDGTGNFISLRTALASITDATASKQYEVQISEGTYDVMGYFTEAEINALTFQGLIKPNYVSLKGIGDKNKVILKGELANTFSTVTIERASTLARYGNGSIENLIITAKNLRYAVHDDYVFLNAESYTKNCNFIKYAGGGYAQAYGEGCRSGNKYVYEDCYFYTQTDAFPYSFHNNVNFTVPSSHKLINCTFENENGTTSIRFGSMGSGQKDIIEMIGCRLKGGITMLEEQSNGVGIDFKLTGYGNDVVPVQIIETNAKQYVYDFVGETKKMYNGDATTIVKGTPVTLNSTGSTVDAFLTTTNPIFLYGIAFEDIAPYTNGTIKIGGYLAISDTNLIGLVLGDKIGIVNGSLAKVTTGEYIGVVTLTNFIKLKF